MNGQAVSVGKLEVEIQHIQRAVDQLRAQQDRFGDLILEYSRQSERMTIVVEQLNEELAAVKGELAGIRAAAASQIEADASIRRQRLVLIGTLGVALIGIAWQIIDKFL